jgi:hypothetical protein
MAQLMAMMQNLSGQMAGISQGQDNFAQNQESQGIQMQNMETQIKQIAGEVNVLKAQRVDESVVVNVDEEKEDANIELEEYLCDGECGSNGDLGFVFCENSSNVECESKGELMVDFYKVSSDGECESCDDSLVEPFDESSATKTQELVKEIINIFEKLWVEDRDQSNRDSKIDNFDKPTTPKSEPTPPNPSKSISCKTIHYTELEISGVMYVDLPTYQGVNLGIQLPLITKTDPKLLSKPGRPCLYNSKGKRQHRPTLLPPCELLQGFAHIYDPFERG